MALVDRPSDVVQRAILGCLLLFPEELPMVEGMVSADDFLSDKYRACFVAMTENPGADVIVLAPKLSGKISTQELNDWTDEQFTSSYLPRYCRELKELSTKEKIWKIATEIRANSETMTSEELKDLAERGLAAISSVSQNEPKDMITLCRESAVVLEARYRDTSDKTPGIPYGITDLDDLTGGMYDGDLIIIAGRPSMGKSALVGNILEHAALNGYKGLSFSLEMAAMQCMDRLLASQGRVNLSRIRNGRMQDNDWARLTSAYDRIKKFNLSIDDTPAISLQEIKSKARRAKSKNGLDIMAVDYLTLMEMNGKKNDSRAREVGEVSRGLKNLARELGIPIILLCQLNRAVDLRPDKRPTMADLRDSGEIEQDADVILFPFREAAYCPKCRNKTNDAEHDYLIHEAIAEIILEKQRNGQRNVSVPVVWTGEFQRFTNKNEIERHWQDQDDGELPEGY